ncbi:MULTISPECIES: NAD(P)-dependent oxidoreductase [unclassified Pseudofrankia]|uniref:NAD-dependent epimerase/dehydratase family protein n=1 Tax=unclassified Pseudofrankia TaxID=2994372 RepID=UPI0008D98D06|nr:MULTISPECIES: NAD(P)-dependent oxidoreductase [unclassified Pseudofrankia]MDT3442222.1 NAD(P)-dependent oxidoreductase [Pseudofrankia sp. BMG5.37]OHV43627.1 hypothetical protein BCD48_27715 [Pseudofrankia sp. BMG5.36]
MPEGKKILVTGATGQIAGPIAENFAQNNEVWCAARFSNPARRAELEAMGIKTCMWDMGSGDFSTMPDDFTHVVHSALNVDPGYDTSITNNAEAVALLMQHCGKAEAFLHVSSFAVYSKHQDHPHHAYAETDALGGYAPYLPAYPVIKLASEATARATARMLDLPTTIARMNTGFSWTGHGGMPVRFYRMLAEGKPVPAPIDFDNICSPISGTDIGDQAHLLLEVASVPATIVNWAGDEPVSDPEMCAHIAELTGVEAKFARGEFHFDGTISDNTRREQLIGKCSLRWKDGVRDTFARLGIISA